MTETVTWTAASRVTLAERLVRAMSWFHALTYHYKRVALGPAA